MKVNIYIFAVLITLVSLSSKTANAQVVDGSSMNLIEQFISSEGSQQYSSAWWNALGRQLTLSIDVPVEEVDDASLQNIIYFATHFRKEVRLNDAVPYLSNILKEHPKVEVRIMAGVALHAIHSATAIEALREALPNESSERVRKLARAAVADYYRGTPALAVWR